MTKEEFDNYRFGVNTVVEYYGEMISLTEVDFVNRWVGIRSGQILKYDEINIIKENDS